MRIWVISDLHLEFDDMFLPSFPEADVCVVAGDVLNRCANSIHWLQDMIAPVLPVIFVPGNHEFYTDSILEGREWARTAAVACPDVHLLDDTSAVIDGVRFIGSTLWTDYELDGDAEFAMAVASLQLNDHRAIAWRQLPSYEGFPPHKAQLLHRKARAFLAAELDKPFAGETVVVTHHAPHPYSVNRRFKGSALNPALASDIADLIVSGRPALWVHGHMHDSVDYVVVGTAPASLQTPRVIVTKIRRLIREWS